jgi:hypothetical protein
MAQGIVLHMGFVNTPYSAQSAKAPMRTAKEHEKKKRRFTNTRFSKKKNAEQVAAILEDKYHILDIFKEKHEAEIKDLVHIPLRELVIQAMSERRQLTSDRMAAYMKPKTVQIEKLFRDFLDREETGIGTAVATREGRQSFIDTGLYRASFRAWVDIK